MKIKEIPIIGALFLIAALQPLSAAETAAGWAAPFAAKFDSFWKNLHSQTNQIAEAEKGPLFKFAEERPLAAGKNVVTHSLILRPDQFGKPYLLATIIERGPGEKSVTLDSGFFDEDGAVYLVSFKRISQDKIQVLRLETKMKAEPKTPESRFIGESVPPQILATLPILRVSPKTGEIAVSAEKLFLSDPSRVGLAMQDNYQPLELIPSKEDSFLGKTVSLTDGLVVGAVLSFKEMDPSRSKTMPLQTVSVSLRYILKNIPQTASFKPRPEDPRAGYFTVDYQNFSDSGLKYKEKPMVHLITRWNLEPTPPQAIHSGNGSSVAEPPAPVPVKKPIVYWIDPSVPDNYRPAVRAGVLAWNAAFEAIGLKGAVVVRDVEKDMTPQQRKSYDPASLVYNVVRWYTSKDSSSNSAIGLSHVNPFTGEIFNASVAISDSFSRGISPFLGEAAKPGHKDSPELASERRAAAGLEILKAGGASRAKIKEYVDEYITEVVMHEIGHTLGLRHNFEGSAAYPLSETGKNGLITSSVMDYDPPNIAPPGQKQVGPYYQAKPGPYDMFAIEYGYKPVGGKKDLAAIAARAGKDPRLAYETDEDADSGIDPRVQKFDLGKDPLDYAHREILLAQNLWRQEESQLAKKKPEDLQKETRAGLRAYKDAATAVIPVIGGMYTTRNENSPQFIPVSPSRERKALDFLSAHIFSGKDFELPPRLLRRIGNNRMGERSNAPLSLADTVLSLQNRTLRSLYDVDRLKRISQDSLYAGPQGVLSMSEFFFRVRHSIWGEIEATKPRAIPLYRRNLQDDHLQILLKLSDGSAPPDARAAAERDLRALQKEVKRALIHPTTLDAATKMHLRSIENSLEDALD